jgi:hypothetical protein
MALEALAVFLCLALPVRWIVLRELDRLDEAAYLRGHGVIIVSERALQGHSAPVGEYRGRPIWGSVRFKGMNYRFDRVIEERLRERIGPRELFLDPGLVYITESWSQPTASGASDSPAGTSGA